MFRVVCVAITDRFVNHGEQLIIGKWSCSCFDQKTLLLAMFFNVNLMCCFEM